MALFDSLEKEKFMQRIIMIIILTLFGREENREELITNGSTIKFNKEILSSSMWDHMDDSRVVNLMS